LNLEQIKGKLEKNLSSKRFLHSVNVMNTSILLAKKFGEDIGKAGLAGLLHDCARELESKEIFELCVKYNIVVDDISRKQSELLHGPIGSVLAQKEFGITEKPILDAICNHTLGNDNMSKLEKIVFLADFIEPARNFKGVIKIRKMAKLDLDKAILLAFDNTFKHCINKGSLIHPIAVFARNQILNTIIANK
jgi:predicted HD superfamily hydrolase involved in NAD metabolism